MVFLFGCAVATTHHLVGVNLMPTSRRRFLTRIQTVTTILFLIILGLDLGLGLRSGASLSVLGTLIGFTWWACISWLLLGLITGVGIAFFACIHYAEFCDIGREIAQVEGDVSRQADGRVLSDMHNRLERLEKVFPTLWRKRPQHLQHRLRSIMKNPSPAVFLERAKSALSDGKLAEGLKWVLKWDDSTQEALLLALECQDWKECYGLLFRNTIAVPKALRVEAAQLMVDLADIAEYRDVGIGMLNDEDTRRRRAAIEIRQGRISEAKVLLAHDGEALNWIHEGESSAEYR